MKLPLYQVDAFTARLFSGNPAAVVPLAHWLDAALMQAIAAENNLSETAFFVGGGGRYALRWFTPTVEVALCGHATLATAYVIAAYMEPAVDEIVFETASGELRAYRRQEHWVLDLPVFPARPCEPPESILRGLGAEPDEFLRAANRNYLAVLKEERHVRALTPILEAWSSPPAHGVIVTAPGDRVDFVSRYFAPAAGVPEDYVTGSAHCTLAPYWGERLRATELTAWQVSSRGGELRCALAGDRVHIGGQCTPYLKGEIQLPSSMV